MCLDDLRWQDHRRSFTICLGRPHDSSFGLDPFELSLTEPIALSSITHMLGPNQSLKSKQMAQKD